MLDIASAKNLGRMIRGINQAGPKQFLGSHLSPRGENSQLANIDSIVPSLENIGEASLLR